MPNTNKTPSTWNEWAKYVLITIDELKKDGATNHDLIQELKTELSILQTKMTMRAALTGALASAIPVAIGLIIWLITRNPS